MNSRLAFILSLLLAFSLLHLIVSPAEAQQNSGNNNTNNSPQLISNLYGEIQIMSNYVEKGLTQSDASPSMGADLGYGFGGYGRIGVKANSVKYENEDVSIAMSLYGEYRFIFSQNTNLTLRNDLVRYFSTNTRDNIVISLDQNIFDYHFLFEYEDNFEGTKTNRNWFGFHKDWLLSPSYQFNLTVGYSMLEIDGFNNYFDTKAGVSFINSNLTAGVFHTYNSQQSQFGEQGKMFFLVEVTARF